MISYLRISVHPLRGFNRVSAMVMQWPAWHYGIRAIVGRVTAQYICVSILGPSTCSLTAHCPTLELHPTCIFAALYFVPSRPISSDSRRRANCCGNKFRLHLYTNLLNSSKHQPMSCVLQSQQNQRHVGHSHPSC